MYTIRYTSIPNKGEIEVSYSNQKDSNEGGEPWRLRKLQIKLEFRGWNCLSRDKGDNGEEQATRGGG